MSTFSANLFAILLELVCTFLLTYTHLATHATPAAMGICLWFCGLIAGRISGAHVNPAVTLAFMLRPKERRLNCLTGLFFILFQVCGSFIAGLMFWWANYSGSRLHGYDFNRNVWFGSLFLEVGGPFCFTLIILMNTDQEARLAQEDWAVYLMIGASLALATMWARGVSGAVFNPAFAVGVDLAAIISGASSKILEKIWIYIACPIGGALLALLYHNFVYKAATDGGDEKQALLS